MLAGGIAIGVFVGLSPTIPFHTPLVIVLALLTGNSVLAGIIVSWLVFNPVTILPIYISAVWIGNAITPFQVELVAITQLLEQYLNGTDHQQTLQAALELGFETGVVLVTGGFLFSLPFAVISYFLARLYFKSRRKRVLRQQSGQ
jgi:uncharacterized protein (DUF2062 family)